MTTSSGRSATTRRSSRSMGQWLLGLLIVLAIVASILMVFSDNLPITGTLAVIAALWAAVIGAILVTRFRKQAESAESKSRDLRLVYELQLEREIAARRQYELDIETTIRREVGAESNAELADLKAQVLSLRSSLEQLLGGPLPEERVALPNDKLRELASGLGGTPFADNASAGRPGDTDSASRFGLSDDGRLADQDFAATALAARTAQTQTVYASAGGRHGGRDAGHDSGRDHDHETPNEQTDLIPVVAPDDPMSGRIATEVPMDEPHSQFHEAQFHEAQVDEAQFGDAGHEATSFEQGRFEQGRYQHGRSEQGRFERHHGGHRVDQRQPVPESGAMSAPFSGGFYVPTGDQQAADQQAAGQQDDQQGAGHQDVNDHEPAARAEGVQTVRRRHEGAEGTDSAGRSVAELLGRLRGPDADTSGRRRRH